jgi:hypothetical protein
MRSRWAPGNLGDGDIAGERVKRAPEGGVTPCPSSTWPSDVQQRNPGRTDLGAASPRYRRSERCRDVGAPPEKPKGLHRLGQQLILCSQKGVRFNPADEHH